MMAWGTGRGLWTPFSCLEDILEGIPGLSQSGKARHCMAAHNGAEVSKGLHSSRHNKCVAFDAELRENSAHVLCDLAQQDGDGLQTCKDPGKRKFKAPAQRCPHSFTRALEIIIIITLSTSRGGS